MAETIRSERARPPGSRQVDTKAIPEPGAYHAVPSTGSLPTTGSLPITGLFAPTEPLPILARRRLGDSDIAVFPVALDCTSFGTTPDDAADATLLECYVQLGGDLVATSDAHPAGQSVVGRWMSRRGMRQRVVVAAAIGHGTEYPGLSQRSILGAADAALTRLKTDCIDVLQLTRRDSTTPLEESLSAAEQLIMAGKARVIVASGFSPAQLMQARVLSANGLPRFTGVQVHYTLLHRTEYDGDLGLVAGAQGLAVLPSVAVDETFADAGGRRAPVFGRWHFGRALRTLEAIALARNSTVAAVAIAWLLAKPQVAAPVVTAVSPEHLAQMMSAAGLRLSRSDVLALDRASG